MGVFIRYQWKYYSLLVIKVICVGSNKYNFKSILFLIWPLVSWLCFLCAQNKYNMIYTENFMEQTFAECQAKVISYLHFKLYFFQYKLHLFKLSWQIIYLNLFSFCESISPVLTRNIRKIKRMRKIIYCSKMKRKSMGLN